MKDSFEKMIDDLLVEMHLKGQAIFFAPLVSPAHDLAIAPPGAPTPRCECGGARALTTHSTWCPLYGQEAA